MVAAGTESAVAAAAKRQRIAALDARRTGPDQVRAARDDGSTPTLLTVTRVGDGVGIVTSTDGTIDCGRTCSHTYDSGSTVTLDEWTYVEGSSFVGWSGACSGTAHACTVSLNAARSVKATFVKECRVPSLRGLSLRNAKTVLSTHDCRSGEISHARSRAVQSGHVISQSPKPGKLLQHYSSVSLVISKGRR
jgi:hypothetical protein